MNLICPISSRQVDEAAVRTIALLVCCASILASFWITPYLVLLLTADFAIRGFFSSSFSPLAAVARLAVRALRLSPSPINAGPKIFAARLGFVLGGAAAISHYLNAGPAVHVCLGILALCAGLEAIFGLCLSCHIYTWLLRLTGRAGGASQPRAD